MFFICLKLIFRREFEKVKYFYSLEYLFFLTMKLFVVISRIRVNDIKLNKLLDLDLLLLFVLKIIWSK